MGPLPSSQNGTLGVIQLEDCYVISGVVLRKDNSPVPARSRSYSIIKTSLERKKTITEDEFKERMKKADQKEEIVYGYNIAQTLGQFSLDLANNITPRNQKRKSPLQYKIAQQVAPMSTQLRKTNSQISTQFKELSHFQPSRTKDYKFNRFNQKEGSGRSSRSRNTPQKDKPRTNLFNFADAPLNGVATAETVEGEGCFCSGFRVVEQKRRNKPNWA